MRGVLHAEVFGFNFSADINPYQRSDDCVIAAGQITERPRRLSKTSADAPETERGTQVGGTHEHTSMCLSSSEMWLTRSIARNHVQSPVFFLKGVYEGRSLYPVYDRLPLLLVFFWIVGKVKMCLALDRHKRRTKVIEIQI